MKVSRTTLLVLAAILPNVTIAQDPGRQVPDAATLLAQAAKIMRGHQSLQYVVESSSEQKSTRGTTKLTREDTVYFVSPAKSRVETKIENLTDSVTVADGEFIWIYRPGPKLYMKRAAVLAMTQALAAVASTNIDNLSLSLNTQPMVTKQAFVKVDGQQRPCWVIETPLNVSDAPNPAEGTLTYCMDKEFGLIVQSTMSLKFTGARRPYDAVEDKMQVRSLKVDQPIAASLFTFDPPKDTKQLPALPNLTLPWTNLTGATALDAAIKTTGGATYSLSSLKGKTVLVLFLTTWCVPCRNAISALEILRNRKDEGLVVIQADAEDNPEATARYRVTAFPTYVLIDPAGKINTYSVGFNQDTVAAPQR
jgi:thioredoxin 1